MSVLPYLSTPLLEQDIKTLHAEKLFSNNGNSNTPFTSVTHNFQGSHFLTTSPDGTLQLYDSFRGTQSKTIYSKKYGCSNVIFTAQSLNESTPKSCIISSTIPTTTQPISNNAMRHLDLTTNSFFRYFHGHTSQIMNIEPVVAANFSNSFVSSSTDGTVRLWDLKTEKSVACLSPSRRSEPNNWNSPVISINNEIVCVYDNQKLSFMPLSTFPFGVLFEIEIPSSLVHGRVEKMIWSKSVIIMDTPGYQKIVVNLIHRKVVGLLIGVLPFAIDPKSDDVARNGSCDITPDGSWCLAGSGDGSILAWELSRLREFSNKEEEILKISPIVLADDKTVQKGIVPRVLSVNPKLGTVVTADTELIISVFTK